MQKIFYVKRTNYFSLWRYFRPSPKRWGVSFSRFPFLWHLTISFLYRDWQREREREASDLRLAIFSSTLRWWYHYFIRKTYNESCSMILNVINMLWSNYIFDEATEVLVSLKKKSNCLCLFVFNNHEKWRSMNSYHCMFVWILMPTVIQEWKIVVMFTPKTNNWLETWLSNGRIPFENGENQNGELSNKRM